MVCYIDFETRSDLDVTETGPHVYAQHPSTDVICLSYIFDGDKEAKLWTSFGDSWEMPKELFNHLMAGGEFEAHNRMFELCIWNEVLVKKYGWPVMPDELLVCSAARAAHMALPRALDKLCQALETKKQKDLEGKRVMLRLSQPRKPTKKDAFSPWHENADDLEKVYSYCKDDVLSERECASHLVKLSSFEQKIWRLDQKMNRQGVLIDRQACENAIGFLNRILKEEIEELIRITNGRVQSPTKLRDIMKFCEDSQVYLPNLQANTINEALKDSDMPNEVRRVLEIRSNLNKASTKKFQAMLTRMGPDNRVRDILMYCGASTGRFSGTGIQVQNLPRGISGFNYQQAIKILHTNDFELFTMMYDNPMKIISGCLRGMIIAPPGKVIRAVDYNAIELRVLMWVSKCMTGLKELAQKQDLYCNTATDIYGRQITKADKDERFIGKETVLGSGYGQGVKGFIRYLANKGVVIGEELAAKAVYGYRNRYKEVPKFWKDIETAFVIALNTKKQAVCKTSGLLVRWHKKYITVTLPSGRNLFYWYPRMKEKMTDYGPREQFHAWYIDSQTKQWVEGPFWGGVFVENIVQAISRDLLCDALIKLDERGYNVLMTVHDEIVTEDKKTFGSLAEIEAIMRGDLPAWAKGLPIEVEGFEDERYRK